MLGFVFNFNFNFFRNEVLVVQFKCSFKLMLNFMKIFTFLIYDQEATGFFYPVVVKVFN